MIEPQSASTLKRCEELAPKRLARCDVADLRRLYDEAWTALSRGPVIPPLPNGRPGFNGAWVERHTIYLTRKTRERTIGRLAGGFGFPRAELKLQWTRVDTIGLNVTVEAYVGGRILKKDERLKVGTHRFRTSTTQIQFCREVSRMVRLGLGWTKEQHSLLLHRL